MSCIDRVSYHGLTAAVRRLLWLTGILLGMLVISAVLGSRAHADEQSATEPESRADPAVAGLVDGLVAGVAEQVSTAPMDEVERPAAAAVEAGEDSLVSVVEPVADAVESVEPMVNPLTEPVAESVLEPIVDEVAPVVAPVTERLDTAPDEEASPSRPDEVRPEGRSDLRDPRPQVYDTNTGDSLVQTDRPGAVVKLPLKSPGPPAKAVDEGWRGSAHSAEVGNWSSTYTTTDDTPPITRSLTTTGVSGTPTAPAASATAVVPESAWPADGPCGWGPPPRGVFVPMSCAMEPETRPG